MSWIENPGEQFEGLNLGWLKLDEAYLRVHTDTNIWLYTLSDDCYRCPYKRNTKISAHEDAVVTLNVAHHQYLRITNGNLGQTHPVGDHSNVLCDLDHTMGEFGVYDLNITNNQCSFSLAKDPVNIYLPLLLTVIVLLCSYFVCRVAKLIYNFVERKKNPNSSNVKEKAVTRKRLKSLDTFRGMSIVLMIFVNYGAGKYWWLEHATWNGLTVGDIVFPTFLWIMGVCIPISVKSILSKNTPKYMALLQIAKRSCTMFIYGIALGTVYHTPVIQEMRIFGVLQRFGISYLVVASLVVICAKNKPKTQNIKGKIYKMFQDITDLKIEWMVILVFLVLHLLINFLVPVPGCPTGYLGAGGMQDNWLFKNCTGGISKYVDLLILGEGHVYKYLSVKEVYGAESIDPEGIFGCILSVVHVFFGVQAGYTLLHHVEWKPVVTRWLCWAVFTGILGGILCGFSKEGGIIPVNKNLWSLSFVLVTTCFSYLLLTILYIIIDVFEVWNGSPFIQPGMNAIFMYIGHSVCYFIFPFHWRYEGMRTHFVFLVEAAWGTALWVIISFVLFRKKIFITV